MYIDDGTYTLNQDEFCVVAFYMLEQVINGSHGAFELFQVCRPKLVSWVEQNGKYKDIILSYPDFGQPEDVYAYCEPNEIEQVMNYADGTPEILEGIMDKWVRFELFVFSQKNENNEYKLLIEDSETENAFESYISSDRKSGRIEYNGVAIIKAQRSKKSAEWEVIIDEEELKKFD